MNQKFVMFALLIMIAMSIGGFAYAQWNDVIVVTNRMTFGDPDMGFVYPLNCTDNEVTKDVGECYCYYTDAKTATAYNTTVITISSGYPGYEVHCNFTLENIGTLPLHINGTIISDPTGTLTWNSTLSALVDADGKPVLNIVISPDLVCKNLTTFEPNNKLEAKIVVRITQNARQCITYTFEVKIIYEEA